eukprot:scaffold201033_cov30-Tisochrysis_lutea.AAC.6
MAASDGARLQRIARHRGRARRCSQSIRRARAADGPHAGIGGRMEVSSCRWPSRRCYSRPPS